MKYTEIYKTPFRRLYSKVFTVNGGMAFDFPFKNGYHLDDETKDCVLAVLNGEELKCQLPKFELTYNSGDSVIYCNGREFIIIRGWGSLTGIGSLNLSQQLAINIQNEFAQHIINKLKGA